jgi:hypothetical protein
LFSYIRIIWGQESRYMGTRIPVYGDKKPGHMGTRIPVYGDKKPGTFPVDLSL